MFKDFYKFNNMQLINIKLKYRASLIMNQLLCYMKLRNLV